MIIVCEDRALSVIGAQWVKEDAAPGFEIFAALSPLAEAMGYPALTAHGDGVNTWEVSVRDRHQVSPAFIEEWAEWLAPPPLTTDRHTIYAHVPTQAVLDYVRSHGGDLTEFCTRLGVEVP